MDDVTKQLEAAAQTSHLVLIFFYADWAPHYNWNRLSMSMRKE